MTEILSGENYDGVEEIKKDLLGWLAESGKNQKTLAEAETLLEEELNVTIKGRDFIQGLPRSAQVSTNEIVRAIDPELKQIIKAIKDVLQETPPELASDIIDHGIIMTGGSSQLRNFTDLIYLKTGVKASLAEDPLFCVVKGTGIALEHLDVYKKAILSKR